MQQMVIYSKGLTEVNAADGQEKSGNTIVKSSFCVYTTEKKAMNALAYQRSLDG